VRSAPTLLFVIAYSHFVAKVGEPRRDTLAWAPDWWHCLDSQEALDGRAANDGYRADRHRPMTGAGVAVESLPGSVRRDSWCAAVGGVDAARCRGNDLGGMAPRVSLKMMGTVRVCRTGPVAVTVVVRGVRRCA